MFGLGVFVGVLAGAIIGIIIMSLMVSIDNAEQSFENNKMTNAYFTEASEEIIPRDKRKTDE